MAGLLRPTSKTSITTNLEITYYDDWVCPDLLLYQWRRLMN